MALQTNTTRSHKKPLIISLVVIALVLLGGYTAYAYSADSWPFTKPSTSDKATTNEASKTDKTNTKTAQPADVTKKDSNGNPPSKTPPQYSPPKNGTPTPKNDLTGVINYKSVQDGALVLRATINQQVSSGTCNLTLTNTASHKTVHRSAQIIARPSASTCDGFSVPLSDLGSGQWNITIQLTSGDKHGTLTGEATIKT